MITRGQFVVGIGGLVVRAPPRRAFADADGATRQANIEITRRGAEPARAAPAEHFTGLVQIEAPFRGVAPSRVGGATVTFAPGARSAWHSHPLGQTLIVTSGVGWVRCAGEGREEIRVGDIVWIPPRVRHWHGATATKAMSHIAIAEQLDGRSVDWLEKVTDDEYRG